MAGNPLQAEEFLKCGLADYFNRIKQSNAYTKWHNDEIKRSMGKPVNDEQ